MTKATWHNIVAETQFATELSLNGLRRLCTVPSGSTRMWGSDEQNYALHVGLYSYTSGLERLCKLAISCYGYVREGKFSQLPKSHDLGKLLDAVEALDLTKIDIHKQDNKYLQRPTDPLNLEAIAMATRFAMARDGGRYEHLDSLLDDDIEVKTYAQWTELAAKATISPEVQRLVSLQEAMSEVVKSVMIIEELEAIHASILPEDVTRIYEPSVGVVLTLFRLVRWASAILDAITYYTTKELPLLGDLLTPTFNQPSQDFFNYSIARFSDDAVVEEELVAAYSRHNLNDKDEDEELE